MVNIENWTYFQYNSSSKRAFISLGAAPLQESNEVEINYLVTVSDENNHDIFQKSFNDLKLACSDLNTRYGHWELSDSRLASNSGSGCDTCEAH